MISATPDPVTHALTGVWPLIMIVSALLTFPVSALLLWFYRRAVLRGMSESRHGGVPVAETVIGTYAPPKPLRFVLLGANAAPPATLPGPRAAAVVYLAAGAAYALVMTAAWFLATHDLQIGPIKAFFIFWTFYWPAMLAVILVAAQDRAQKIWVVLGYVAIYVALAIVELVRSPEFTWKQAALFWLIENGPATVLLYLFLKRRLRSVGPLVLVFAIIALLGAQLAISLLWASEARMLTAVKIGAALGLGGSGVFVATLLLGLLLFAVFAWLVLRWIGVRYSAKKFSDESLTVDVIFVLFSIIASVDLVFEHWTWIATGLVALVAYKVVARIGFRLLPRTPSPKRLLLLRVFALGKRSEPLFDAMRKAWLRGGPIAMIAGPDLVTSAVEPHEFLGFLSGKLGRRFVGDDADLDRRAAAMDSQPDADGRYRVAEFFCRADTWQPTMRRLVADSDAVLMDLRSFSASNRGCVYELGSLLDTIDLSRIVFVTDKTTDRPFLEMTLQQQWSSLAAESPNRFVSEPAARFFEVRGPTATETRALVGHLASRRS
jgi:hypothetical protein